MSVLSAERELTMPPDKIIDLEAYFQRIGYAGPHTATQETLRMLHALHPQAIAFENLSPLLGWPVLLDAQSLERKLVHEGRGGYCFEQNLLLSHVLKALGFEVSGLAARVMWFAPEGTVTARGHMLLRIELDGATWLADVGFGAQTLTAPLRLEADVEQTTPHESFRLKQSGDNWQMQAAIRDTWKALYSFDLQEQLLPDYEVTNWYLSHHPESRFVTGLIAARTAPDHRYALRDNELAMHPLHGQTQRRVLESGAQVRSALENEFRIRLSDAPELDRALDRIAQREHRPSP